MTPARFLTGCHAKKRILNRFFGIRDFPHLKLGIQEFKAKSERDLGLKVCAGGGMPKILHEVLGRDYRSEKPYWGPSENESLLSPGRQLKKKKKKKIWAKQGEIWPMPPLNVTSLK